jgi:hypothetical protein
MRLLFEKYAANLEMFLLSSKKFKIFTVRHSSLNVCAAVLEIQSLEGVHSINPICTLCTACKD